MKSTGIVVLMLVCFLVVIHISSYPTPREQIKIAGLSGEHSLALFRGNFKDIKGVPSESYFESYGTGTGDIGLDKASLCFIINRKDGSVAKYLAILPLNKIHFIIDEIKETPTIEFVFDENWLNELYDDKKIWNTSYLYIDNIIHSDKMVVAKIRMPSPMMYKQIYFALLNVEDSHLFYSPEEVKYKRLRQKRAAMKNY